jgi:hypothetical protein
VRAETGTDTCVPLVDAKVHEPLTVEMHHWYPVAPVLAAHLSVTGERWFRAPFPGEVFENAAGGVGPAWVANVHQVPPFASVSPVAFEARTCQ